MQLTIIRKSESNLIRCGRCQDFKMHFATSGNSRRFCEECADILAPVPMAVQRAREAAKNELSPIDRTDWRLRVPKGFVAEQFRNSTLSKADFVKMTSKQLGLSPQQIYHLIEGVVNKDGITCASDGVLNRVLAILSRNKRVYFYELRQMLPDITYDKVYHAINRLVATGRARILPNRNMRLVELIRD